MSAQVGLVTVYDRSQLRCPDRITCTVQETTWPIIDIGGGVLAAGAFPPDRLAATKGCFGPTIGRKRPVATECQPQFRVFGGIVVETSPRHRLGGTAPFTPLARSLRLGHATVRAPVRTHLSRFPASLDHERGAAQVAGSGPERRLAAPACA